MRAVYIIEAESAEELTAALDRAVLESRITDYEPVEIVED